jgi:hypothetical protein
MTNSRLLIGLLLVCALAPAAWAQKKTTLGVFLPTTLADGQERFDFAEKLAAQLGTALDQPMAAKSFGRYEDFAKAISDGTLDFAMVDAWAAVQLGPKATPLAFAALSGDTTQRWAVISYGKGSVKDLSGKRLALTKGAGPSDPKFVSNVIFAGDLDAQKHFNSSSPSTARYAWRRAAKRMARSWFASSTVGSASRPSSRAASSSSSVRATMRTPASTTASVSA